MDSLYQSVHQSSAIKYNSSMLFSPLKKRYSLKKLSHLAIAVGIALGTSSAFAVCSEGGGRTSCYQDGSDNLNHSYMEGSTGAISVDATASPADATLTLTKSTIVGLFSGDAILVSGANATAKLNGGNTITISSANRGAAVIAKAIGDSLIRVSTSLDIDIKFALPGIATGITTGSGLEAIGENVFILHHGNGTIASDAGSGLVSKASNKTEIELTGNAILDISGANNHGINAITQNGAVNNGAVNIESNATMTINGLQGHGIFSDSDIDSGSIDILHTDGGDITVKGDNSSAIRVESSGNATILVKHESDATIKSTGVSANAMYITKKANSSGNIDIIVDGKITTEGNYSTGVYAEHFGIGNITISGSSTITTDRLALGSVESYGLAAISESTAVGDVTVNYRNGAITTGGRNGHALYAASLGEGHAQVVNTGGTLTTTGDQSYGIWVKNNAVSGIGEVLNSGNITTTGEQSHAIVAESASNNINILNSGTLKTHSDTGMNNNSYAIYAVAVTGTVTIENGGDLQGGTGNAGGIYIDAGAALQTINNAGQISALNDKAIISSSLSGNNTALNNYGTITGVVSLGNNDAIFSNHSSNSWNIRNFADTDNNGIRDTKAVAISDFGSGYDIFNNESTGMVRLSAVSEPNYDDTNEYTTSGAFSIANSGTVQGQLLNLNRFENRGTIDLSENGQAGDILLITNSTIAGSNGNGQFVADGGQIILDTVLNEGDSNSLSDILVLDDVVKGTKATQILINHISGMGALTTGDGIKVIEVLGSADVGSFVLGNVVRVGLYEYTLHEGSIITPTDKSLFLRSSMTQISPDVGSYLANQTAATGLFMHTLHDRLGEPQYYQNNKTEDKAVPAVWVRVVASKTKNEAAGGFLTQNSESTLVHLGGEMANWTSNGDNRYHLGVMGAYGRLETKTTSQATNSQVNSSVGGYGVGAYLTWYQDPSAVEGWYTDIWSMYNWFDNKTEGSDSYNSKSWTSSVEAGYASKIHGLENYDWMLEPQAQVAYNYYTLDEIKDRNGLNVTDSDANGVATRLGARTYLRPSTDKASAQPFLEVNWLYNSANNSMVFNNEKIADDTPSNRYEAKVGVQGEMTKNLQIYSHIGLQLGQNSYQNSQGQVGIRYRF